jgi:putative membrane protein
LKEEGIKNKIIALIAVVLPVAVAVLYYLPKGGEPGELVRSIPMFNAILNGSTFVVLVAGIVAIKSGNKVLHRILMMTAFMLGVLFLIGYVAYHSQVESTHFGGEGMAKMIYFFLLITHIVLAAGLAPLVLITFSRALKGNFEGHKKMAKWTYPIWMYVSITGIIVYLMIEPYYPVL